MKIVETGICFIKQNNINDSIQTYLTTKFYMILPEIRKLRFFSRNNFLKFENLKMQ